jgi:hypothetical protein
VRSADLAERGSFSANASEIVRLDDIATPALAKPPQGVENPCMPQAHKWIFVLLVALFGCGGGALAPTDAADILPCSALKPLADQQVLVPWKTHYAYYSPDRSFLLLQVRGATDRLIRVELPSGNTSTVVDALSAAEPLGSSGAFLLYRTGSGGDDTVVYDGKQVRKLFSGTCILGPTPDGTRLYVAGQCVGEENGLEVIDVATGTSNIVDKHAVMGPIMVSPNGQWIAYQTGNSYNVNDRTIVVADAAGSSYTIASAQDVSLLEFASDDLLVFQATGPSDSPGDIRGHVPGSGDTSFVIAADQYPGYDFPCYGHQFSPDRTRMLAVKWSAPSDTNRSTAIYSVPLHGGDPLLLLENWSVDSSVGQPFAFDSQGRYAMYVSLSGYEPVAQGPVSTYTVSVVDMQGSRPRKLSGGWEFEVTPATSSVLLIDTAADGRYRLRLTDLATGFDRLSYSSYAQVYSPTALRGDQAVLFAELDGATRRSRFMSVSYPQSVVLGEWDDPDYRGLSPMPVEADPTGCFTVVNTEVPSPGTRLVLLPK